MYFIIPLSVLYNMFWSYAPFLQQFFLNPVLFPHSPNVSSCFVKVGFCFVLFLSTPRTICAVQMFFDVWISTGAWPTYWSTAPLLKKIDPSFPSILQLSIAHQMGLRLCPTPLSRLGFGLLNRSGTCCCGHWDHTCRCLLCPEDSAPM